MWYVHPIYILALYKPLNLSVIHMLLTVFYSLIQSHINYRLLFSSRFVYVNCSWIIITKTESYLSAFIVNLFIHKFFCFVWMSWRWNNGLRTFCCQLIEAFYDKVWSCYTTLIFQVNEPWWTFSSLIYETTF